METLIPDDFFLFLAGKSILLVFLSLFISFLLLFKGSDWFVDGAAGGAKILKIPPVIIGATIVSLGTTAPEATVSIMAAFKGYSGLAMGNSIGSVICNTALVFGLCCCISRIPADKFIIAHQGRVKLISGISFAFLCYILLLFGTAYINRLMGLIILAVLCWYMFMSVKWAKKHEGTGVDTGYQNTSKLVLAGIFLLGLVLIIFGSRALIGSVTQICTHFGIPKSVVAASVVAFGTSVPELATGIASLIKGHKEIMLGNVIGANILNILFVIGAASAVAGLKIQPEFYYLHLPVFVLVISIFSIYSWVSKTTYRRWFGLPLLTIYVVYIVLQYATGMPA
jgi:cation:H+ antiporter